MIEQYKNELALRGIENLDEIREDGTFTKLIINSKENPEPGYVGVIEIDKTGKVEVIFVRHSINERRLVCDNFRGTYIQSDLSLIEDRDPVTLFDDYCKDANLFIDIQREKERKRYMMYKATGITQEDKANIVAVIDNEIDAMQNKLEAGRKLR